MAHLDSQDLFKGLVDTSVNPVFAVDRNDKILTWNWGCEQVFGRTREQAVSRRMSDLVDRTESSRTLREGLEEARGTGWAVCDAEIRRENGTVAHVRFVIRTINPDDHDTLAVTAQDRTELVRLEQQLYHQIWTLTESEKNLRNLIPDAVVVMDPDRTIILANDQMEALFGYPNRQIVGKPLDFFIPEIFDKRHGGQFDKSLRTPLVLPTNGESVLYGVCKDGSRFPVEVSLGPVPRDGEKLTAAIRDVTDRVKAQEEHREVQRLKAEDEFKARFINTAAHELKTPLTALNIQIHLLRDERKGTLNAEQAKHLAIVERTAKRFNRLVEDLLDTARLQSHRFRLRLESMEVDRLVKQAVESMQAVARQAGIEIHLDVGQTPNVEADAERLNQVLLNLLNNAIKFTPEGGQIVVSTKQEADNVVVTVSDTGIGLEEDEIERLFQPFSQVPPSGGDRGGSGLGLYLSKGIIKLHGGRIWCESPGRGQGSTFGFEVPLQASSSEPESSATS